MRLLYFTSYTSPSPRKSYAFITPCHEVFYSLLVSVRDLCYQLAYHYCSRLAFIFKFMATKILFRTLCQGFRSFSRKERCPRCTLGGGSTLQVAKIPDWPKIKAVAEFRLCVGQDCLDTHLHRIGIRPDPYCMLCSLPEPTDRNHLGQCTALLNRTECERYWEARTQMVDNRISSFSITIFCEHSLSLGRLYLL